MRSGDHANQTTWRLGSAWHIESLGEGSGYLLHDSVTDQRVRLTPRATDMALLFRAPLDIDAALEDAVARWPDQHPDECRAVLSQLQKSGVLTRSGASSASTVEASRTASSRQRGRQWLNPFSVRIDMADPSGWLSRHPRIVGALFGRWGALGVCVALLTLPLLLFRHASDLSRYLLTDVSTSSALAATVAVWPFLKLLHECAHAGVLHRFGGTVKRCGITLLFFLPLPFVDASDAWRLPSRWQRILVSMAGVLSELFIACVCLAMFPLVADGLLKTVLASTVMVACVSSLLINANPLMKFDGYHVLQDVLRTGNLQQQSAETVKRLLWRGLGASRHAARLPSRWKTFLVYGVAALLFKLFVVISLCLWFVRDIPLIGSALAGLLVLTACALPVLAFVKTTLADRATLFSSSSRRWRATASVALVLVAFTAMPLPRVAAVDGVVAFHDARAIAPRSSGELHWRVADGGAVKKGEVIAELRAPALEHAVSMQSGVVQRLAEVRRSAVISAQPADRENLAVHESRLQSARIDLENRQRKLNSLAVVAEHDGVVSRDALLVEDGNWVEAGREIATLIPHGRPAVHVLVDQRLASQLESELISISAASRDSRRVQVAASMVSLSPVDQVPADQRALTQHGGGVVTVDQDMRPALAGSSYFSSRLELDDAGIALGRLGQRVVVRYRLAPLPAAMQLTSAFRDTFFHINS